MDNIPFTQYLRPNGKITYIQIDMEDQELHDKAETIIEAGYHFDIEVLRTGMISMTCERDPDQGEVYIQVCRNGPPVPVAVRTLVEEAHAALVGQGGNN